MKKIKIVFLAALVILSVILMASCSNIINMMNYEFVPASTIGYSTALSVYGDPYSSAANLLLFENEGDYHTVYTVYDMETESSVLSVTQSHTAKIDGSDVDLTRTSVRLCDIGIDSAYIYVAVYSNETDLQISAKLYDGQGELIASCDGDPHYTDVLGEYVVFDGNAYGLDKKDNITKLFAVDEFNLITSATHSSEKYFYVVNGNNITVLDRKGNPLNIYNIKENNNLDESDYFILENGNIVVQYREQLPSDAESYDIYDNGDKLLLTTEIVNAESGRTKKLDVDFIINMLYAGTDEMMKIADNKNLAYITRIENKNLLSEYETVILTNKLTEKASAYDIIDGGDTMEQVAEDLYMVEDINDNLYLINSNGKIVKSFAGKSVGFNDKYIWTEAAIYDYEFNKLFALKADGYSVTAHARNYLVIEKTEEGVTTYYCYNNGNAVEITLSNSSSTRFEDVDYTTGLYCIYNTETGKYLYYNCNGKFVGEYDGELYYIKSVDNGNMLVSAGEGYYLLKPIVENSTK